MSKTITFAAKPCTTVGSLVEYRMDVYKVVSVAQGKAKARHTGHTNATRIGSR